MIVRQLHYVTCAAFFRICFLHFQWQSGATGIALLKGNGSLSPDQGVEHLSPIAAKMILATLSERIQRGLLGHTVAAEYPIEMVLEMAIAGFLDSECLNFTDCQPKYD